MNQKLDEALRVANDKIQKLENDLVKVNKGESTNIGDSSYFKFSNNHKRQISFDP